MHVNISPLITLVKIQGRKNKPIRNFLGWFVTSSGYIWVNWRILPKVKIEECRKPSIFSAFICNDLNLFSKLFMACFLQILFRECCYIHRRKALVIFKPLDNVCVFVLISIVISSALLYFAKFWHLQNYFKPAYDCFLLLFQK